MWEGKYDEYGQRREVDIAGCAMPMQKIEGIDESRREAAANQQLTLFEQQNPRVDDFRNRLVWGDNKLVIAWQPSKLFTHDWQDYRSLKTISDAAYQYPAPGKYIACVKVVDTFGCDTSITVEVKV